MLMTVVVNLDEDVSEYVAAQCVKYNLPADVVVNELLRVTIHV
jgi:hypothetical protein